MTSSSPDLRIEEGKELGLRLRWGSGRDQWRVSDTYEVGGCADGLVVCFMYLQELERGNEVARYEG